jgi:hypothetical protein
VTLVLLDMRKEMLVWCPGRIFFSIYDQYCIEMGILMEMLAIESKHSDWSDIKHLAFYVTKVPQKLKDKFYRTVIQLAILYSAKCWPTKTRHVEQISIGEGLGGIDGQEHRPGVSAHGRARGGFLPSNSCLLYFSSIDYINRPAGCPYLARDPYLLKTLLKTLNKLLTDNLPR